MGGKYIPIPAGGACGGAGSPGGMEGVSPSEAAGGTVPAPAQYDLITDLLDTNMFKLYADMLKREKQRVKGGQSDKFGYLSMMTVATLGVLNAESFCERILSSVKLVVSDLHVSLKPSEIRMLVMFRMNHGFMEYMRKTYPNTPLSEFKSTDVYVRTHGLDDLVDDEEEEKDEEV